MCPSDVSGLGLSANSPDPAQSADYVRVTSGDPNARPSGNPCFGCGRQVRTERAVRALWPNGVATSEAICSRCAPIYRRFNEDRHPDAYRAVWACPRCGALHYSPVEPCSCARIDGEGAQ